jgi:hypothetical protein
VRRDGRNFDGLAADFLLKVFDGPGELRVFALEGRVRSCGLDIAEE